MALSPIQLETLNDAELDQLRELQDYADRHLAIAIRSGRVSTQFRYSGSLSGPVRTAFQLIYRNLGWVPLVEGVEALVYIELARNIDYAPAVLSRGGIDSHQPRRQAPR